MRRWLERFAAVALAGLIVVTLLACWMPAYVGATPGENGPRWRWPRDDRGAADRPSRPADRPAASR